MFINIDNKPILVFLFIIGLTFFGCKNAYHREPIIFKERIVIDEYFGKDYTDPFRYIENLEDSMVIELLHQQNRRAEKYISGISNYQKILKKQNQIKSVNVKIFNLEITKKNQYFYLKQDSTQAYPSLFLRQSFHGEEILLYDPKNFRPETKNTYLINYIKPSWDGKKVAVSLTKNDEEISEIIIIDVDLKKALPHIIPKASPSNVGGVSWLPDNTGFIYTHFPVIDKNSKNFLQNTSAVLFLLNEGPAIIRTLLSKKNNPDLGITPVDFPIVSCESENSRYLFGRIAGARNFDDYYYADLTKDTEEIQWLPLYKKEDKIYEFYFDGINIIYRTAKNAPNYKLCRTSISNPDFQNPEVLVDEDPVSVLEEFIVTKNGVYLVKIKNGVEANLYRYADNNIEKLSLPDKSGNITLSFISHEYNDLWVQTAGWASNRTRYRYDFRTSEFKEGNLYPVTKFEEMGNCIVEEVEVESHDGVWVPLSIIYKEGTRLNGKTPLFIGGYGAYGHTFSPGLDSYLYHWVSEGGIYAIAHVRGGGEKGDTWHKGGYKATKANTWKDFNACTEYLIKNKYSNPEKIVAWSESAGGILIGRAITEKPHLYKAAVIGKGFFNAMRLEYGRNGESHTQEFGTVKDSVSIQYLYNMDAYHHIKKGVKYPAIYLTAGMNDARLPAWQPAKFAAKMQLVNSNITLLSVDFEGGHGFNALTQKINKEVTDVMAFAFWQVGHPDYQLENK